MIVDAKKQISDSKSLLYNLQELQNDIIDRAETLGDAQDYFSEYMAREWEKDKVEAS
jgi:GTP cyclohydrolase II